MKKEIFFGLFAIMFIFSEICLSSPEPIRTLIWWDYLPEKTIQKLKKNGFYPDVSIYNSNEVASSRLFSKREEYDVAIISSVVVNAAKKAQIFEDKILENFTPSRRYKKEVNIHSECIPLLWGVTIFGSDSTSKLEPKSFKELIELQVSGYKIAVLDDACEVAARLLADGLFFCEKEILPAGNTFHSFQTCKNKKLQIPFKLEVKDFRSSVGEFLLNKQVAVYGWHGEIAQAAKDNPKIKMVVPAEYPVIGADYVCIPKKRAHPKLSEARLRKFVELLTDQESTHWGVQSTQYFSPYENDTQGLRPDVLELYKKLVATLQRSAPVMLTAPSQEEHQLINEWWRKIRYESAK